MSLTLTAFFGYLVQILPATALILFLFRGRMRFSPGISVGALAVIIAVSGYFFALIASNLDAIVPGADENQLRFCCFACFMIIDYLCLLAFFEESLSRKLFFFGVVANYSQAVSTLSLLIMKHFSAGNSSSFFSLTNTLISLWLLVFTFPFIFYYLTQKVTGLLDTISDAIWGRLAMISVLYFAILSISGLFLPAGTPDTFSQIAMSGIIAGALILYLCIFMVLKSAAQERDREIAEKQTRYLLDMQLTRAGSIRQSISDLRRNRHDLRHHFTTLSPLADSGTPGTADEKLARIQNYLSDYSASLDQRDFIPLCHNVTLDGILNYYRMQALDAGIAFECGASIPEDCPIPDPLLSVVVGNGLENALDGAKTASDGQGQIIFKARVI
ncbi:MAG: hypothetical protein PHI94_05245, partial [Eubacteriaceae bacterium]|nr:hypothetical protein [Eubacteriaceae bacterium]